MIFEEITGQVKDRIEVDKKEYYIVENLETKELTYVPIEKVEIFKNLDLAKPQIYYQVRGRQKNKNFLTIIYHEYRIGKELVFEIEGERIENGQEFFLLRTEYKSEVKVQMFDWQKGQKNLLCRVKRYSKGYALFQNVDYSNSKRRVGDLDFYKISEFLNQDLQTFLKVESTDNQSYFVKAGRWQREGFWSMGDVRCSVVGFDPNHIPNLRIDDIRHPVFKAGDKVHFRVERLTNTIGRDNVSRYVIQLKDDFGDEHSVLALPNQENKIDPGTFIECEVNSIRSGKLILKQVNPEDPFFYSFEEVIDDPNLKIEFFDPYVTNELENEKLKNQYNQKSGFWLLTYCNYTLNQIRGKLLTSGDLRGVLTVCQLKIKIEEWIINNNFLFAIKNEIERASLTEKTINVIDRCRIEKSVLEYILSERSFEEYNPPSFLHVYYFLSFKSEQIENPDFLINGVGSLSPRKGDNFFISKTNEIVENKLRNLPDLLHKQYFILAKKVEIDNVKKIVNYQKWLFFQIQLLDLLKIDTEKNIKLSRLSRVCSYLEKDPQKISRLLFNSFKIVSNLQAYVENPFQYSNNEIVADFDKLFRNDVKMLTDFRGAEIQRARVVEKYYQGFKAYIGDAEGFIPFQFVTDSDLKNFVGERLDWEVNV